ncbi:MFS transporter [Litorimonas sp. RW-G-Af-16]|uniref:MFS transporter n=1 Tax=Litorimonas sp. RW-G-Af-16 TaxID=3241168 RepID=UPI00390CBF02
MRTVLGSVGTLLLSAAILLAGGGLLATLVAVRADGEGFPLEAIGLLTSGYYAGFMAGCLATPFLVKRVGHVRVFAALSALTAAAVLFHVIAINVPVWFVLRILTGFAFAGLYMLIESWINEQTPNEQRGQVLSIYRMVDLGAVTAGQFMLTLADPQGFVLFSVVAICVCLAIFPISLSTSKAPMAVTTTSLNIKKLLKTVPLAGVGCFAVGLANGSFWALAPVFVRQLGHPVVVISLFMSIAIATGALLQWPVGFLSDKFGRRKLIIAMSALAAGAGYFLWHYSPQSVMLMLVGGALYGGFGMQLYGLSAAHANDHAEPHEFVSISGGLLLIYGIGSIIGPSLAPFVMSAFEPSAMFAFTGVVHAMLMLYALYRRVQHDGPEKPKRFVSMPRPRSMMAILRADPRVKRPKKPKKTKGAELDNL